MNKVELREGTSVVTSDGKEVGKVNRFILDPRTNEVTHIVVQKGWLFSEDKVVPFDRISSATEVGIVLSDDIGDFDQLPPFEETHFVRLDDEGAAIHPSAAGSSRTYLNDPAYYWYPPFGYTGLPAYGLPYSVWPLTDVQQNIPSNTVPLKEGTNVLTSDGKHVGDVEQLLVDSDSGKVTHFLISEGVVFKDHKQIPANWIRSVTDDRVDLTVSSSVLERLPFYES